MSLTYPSKKFLTWLRQMPEQIKFKTIRISEKGQVAIPVEIQRDMGIGKGDELLLIKKGGEDNIGKAKEIYAHLTESVCGPARNFGILAEEALAQ
jgi:AbrB family looped-hinge helix DNA binding protein